MTTVPAIDSSWFCDFSSFAICMPRGWQPRMYGLYQEKFTVNDGGPQLKRPYDTSSEYDNNI